MKKKELRHGRARIVRVFHFRIAMDDAIYASARLMLSSREQTRCDGFRSREARQRHAVGRAMTRLIGAANSGFAPWDWPLTKDARGKPICLLAGAPRFNISHSGGAGGDGHGILAMGSMELGIDIEGYREMERIETLSELVMTEQERSELLALPSEARSRAFLRLWTRKEAVLKATGEGLGGNPKAIAAGTTVSTPMVNEKIESPDGRTWFATDVPIAEEAIATLACEGPAAPTIETLTAGEVATWLKHGPMAKP